MSNAAIKLAPLPSNPIVGRSEALAAVMELIERVGPSRSSVLLTGETGTGKELLARAIHDASPRRNAPFVAVNLAAIPESLVEGELFGHTSGAFTGASKNGRAGRLDQAFGGTLFLDEVGDLPLSVQVKLLRVIQERSFERLGDNTTQRTDFRLIAATHRDLEAMVARGEFREDLYYRLNVVAIRAPALRERLSDVRSLAAHFVGVFSERDGIRVLLTEEALVALEQRSWPGNVRELEHTIDRAVALSRDGEWIDAQKVAAPRTSLAPVAPAAPVAVAQAQIAPTLEELIDAGRSLDETLADFERALLHEALRKCNGNLAEVARRLRMPRQTLQHRLRKYGPCRLTAT